MTQIIELPGLIDPHVHFRDPGQTHKEDIFSGTAAALAGGFTTVMDMPNNLEPITTLKKLEEKIKIASSKTVCDIGFHFGTLGDNFDEFPKIIDKVKGLKIYLNVTTGNFIIDKDKLLSIYKAWPGEKPILLHAEEDVTDIVMKSVTKTKKATHICHVSSEKELKMVIKAKDMGLPMTCGITPHHLFLSDEDGKKLGPFGKMKPALKPKSDQKFIWDHLEYVDIIESDHAPHTLEEKQSVEPPFGVPGLETTLSLMLMAEHKGKLSRSRLLGLLHDNAAKIFDIKDDPDTKVEVELSEFKLDPKRLNTKAGWSPFTEMPLYGKVKKVYLKGTLVFDGKLIATPGSGRIIS